jgi:ABC-type nitrate/sulfonate/bicarbonate transport system substrate-binding protein
MRHYRDTRRNTYWLGPKAVLVAIALLSVTACSSGSQSTHDTETQQDGTKKQDQHKLTLFLGPNTESGPAWMAKANHYYKDAGLDVTVKSFPSGTTALESYRTGQGDIVLSGDLPSLQYWINNDHNYRAISVSTRHSKGYALETRSDIKAPKDLVGKTVATRVGSSGSWFLSEYFSKNGIPQKKVNVRNLDTDQMPVALCKNEIKGYFIWQPFAAQAKQKCGSKVHRLSDAEGYIRAYTFMGARPGWLKKHADVAKTFVKATTKGARYAEAHPNKLAQYLHDHYGQNEKEMKRAMTYTNMDPLFDQQFRHDYKSLSKWNISHADSDQKTEPVDFDTFTWTKGVDKLHKSELPNKPPKG